MMMVVAGVAYGWHGGLVGSMILGIVSIVLCAWMSNATDFFIMCTFLTISQSGCYIYQKVHALVCAPLLGWPKTRRVAASAKPAGSVLADEGQVREGLKPIFAAVKRAGAWKSVFVATSQGVRSRCAREGWEAVLVAVSVKCCEPLCWRRETACKLGWVCTK
jgi:MFS-type transporter involved in bile tolerance (Atg22 family)